jgi:hypothetical protein
MNTHHKAIITLLLASLLSVVFPVRLSAQTSLWKVVNTELRNDDRQFIITLERSFLNDEQRNDARIKKMQVVIRSDNTLLSYQPVDAAAYEKITIDLDNKNERSSLIELLADYQKTKDAQQQRASSGLLTMGDDGQNVKSFSGTLGDFDVSYATQTDPSYETQSGKYGGYIKLVSKDDDNKKYRAIIEPTALEQAIASADSFRQMQQEAIQTKEKRLAAQKALQEEQAQDEIAKAKADSAERMKKEETDRQQQLANLENKQQLQTIKNAEIEVHNKKALAYLSSPEGKDLVQQIRSQRTECLKQQKEEDAYIKPYNDRVNALQNAMNDLSLSTLDHETVAEELKQAYGAQIMAQQQHKDSPELTKLQQNLSTLLKKFKLSSSMDYDDAMKLSQAPQTK